MERRRKLRSQWEGVRGREVQDCPFPDLARHASARDASDILRLCHIPPAPLEKRRRVDLKVQVLGARKGRRAEQIAKSIYNIRYAGVETGRTLAWRLAGR